MFATRNPATARCCARWPNAAPMRSTPPSAPPAPPLLLASGPRWRRCCASAPCCALLIYCAPTATERPCWKTLDASRISDARPRGGRGRRGVLRTVVLPRTVDKIGGEVARLASNLLGTVTTRAAGRGGRRGAVELSAADGRLEIRPGAGRRQLSDPETFRKIPAHRHRIAALARSRAQHPGRGVPGAAGRW